MIRNYFKIAWRNLLSNKGYSLINIGGLALGMAVFMVISLWIWDELSFNKSFKNYESVGQLYQNRTFNGSTDTYDIVPYPIGKELRTRYPEIKEISVMMEGEHILAYKEKVIQTKGMFVENTFPKIFTLEIRAGDVNGLSGVNGVMISHSLAMSLFGKSDPIGEIIRFDNKANVQISAVFTDFPPNSSFFERHLFGTMELYLSLNDFARSDVNNWGNNNYKCFVQLNEKANWESVQAKIKNIFLEKLEEDEMPSKPELLVQPMSKWHLYNTFIDGKNAGGAIEIVWLFGLIGGIVLLLASINFMNLSTARSETRAKEIGLRKAVGSLKSQLVFQFLSESFLTVSLAFLFSLGMVVLSLSSFNTLTGKSISFPVGEPVFWLASIGFILATSLLAGGYPAFFLSSINSVKALKGSYSSSNTSKLPRKILVVLQFAASVILIIGTLIVYAQIQYIKDRPIGYDSHGLIYVAKNTPEIYEVDYDLLRSELLATGVVENMGESSNRITAFGALQTGFTWEGLDPATNPLINMVNVTHDYGKTVGFEILEGRDFSRDFSLDESAVILNETAAALLQKDRVVGEVIKRGEGVYPIIGVIKDIINESPFEKPLPALYFLDYGNRNIIHIKIKETVAASHALEKLANVFKKHNPASPFDYSFVDQEFARKYAHEVMLGKLALLFSLLAIIISALGLFGLSSFVASQRTKEIGIRKTLGASVISLWGLLTKDFSILVLISIIIAIPVSWHYMNVWLQKYTYHIEISWWIFALSALGAIGISLLTVSYQSIKAANANPIDSLRTE